MAAAAPNNYRKPIPPYDNSVNSSLKEFTSPKGESLVSMAGGRWNINHECAAKFLEMYAAWVTAGHEDLYLVEQKLVLEKSKYQQKISLKLLIFKTTLLTLSNIN